MRAHNLSIFLITLLLTSFKIQITNAAKPERRILHQPLFPVDSTPLIPPPPLDIPDEEGQPFSNEAPAGPTLDQSYQPPPLPYIVATTAAPTPPNSNHIKKLLIATSSTLVTVGMLFAMAFFLHKNRGKHHENDSQKLVGRVDEESRAPPPAFLCIEPSATRGLASSEANIVNGSPYHKLNHRPPLTRPSPPPPPPPPPRMSSPPPPMSSSDDDSHNTRFSSNDSPSSRYYNTSNKGNNVASKPLPHSKRTPPKSRFSTPSSPPQPIASLGPLQSCKPLPSSLNRTKFSPSPPSPGVVSHERKVTQVPIPPPPPPPPPPPTSMTKKNWASKKHTSSPVFKQTRRSKSKSPSPKASPSSEKTRAMEEVNNEGSRPKMKPLHWDKVRSTADRATVWDHLKTTSFRLNEGAMESLFGCNSVTPVPREAPRKFVLPCFEQENRILDSKKSQNIAILLRALNVTREEVSEALIDGNQEGLGSELFETLVKMAPSKEEETRLREYNDEISKLGTAERFLKAILEIPFAFKRVEALLYKANFNTEVKYLRKSFQTLEEASEELKNSRLFLKLLEAVLRTGNHMNDGTNRGDAKAFKLDTLLKLGDVKGKDGKTTLLHFVVQEVIRSEGESTNSRNLKFREEDFRREGLQVVAGLSKELGNVKRAAGMDSDVLSGYVWKLELGLETVRNVVQYEMNTKFVVSMNVFLEEAGDEISRVKAEERKALALVKEVTQYFHGDDAKREGHPLRIFMVVRDFLGILDNVCKEVGRMQERSTISAGNSFRISVPVLSRYNMQNDRSSDDDSM